MGATCFRAQTAGRRLAATQVALTEHSHTWWSPPAHTNPNKVMGSHPKALQRALAYFQEAWKAVDSLGEPWSAVESWRAPERSGELWK
eukprot:7605964-Alexandrium_andersonii.AAC.1